MKIPLSWLKEKISLTHTPEEIARLLTGAGLEVESIESVKGDWVLDVALTPNLGHCASVTGIARELAALTTQKLKETSSSTPQQTKLAPMAEILEVEKCPRYACCSIRNVKIAPSPAWLTDRLEQCGMRSVNNVVDATNYVMLELGHPLHAFDFNKIVEGKLRIRNAQAGEKLTTLDGKDRALQPETLVIADGKKALAVAGVMGGLESEVGEGTTHILVESAYFLPAAVRRTSKALGLQTESSRRFERGADPLMVLEALQKVALLIVQLAGGEIEGISESVAKEAPSLFVDCRLSRINALLGQHLSVGEVEDIFSRLGLSYSWDRKDTFHVQVPSRRHDIKYEVDLVEEVARIYGYNHLKKTAGRYHVSSIPHAPIFLFERQVRDQLIDLGLQELLTCDLLGPTLLQCVRGKDEFDEKTIHVLNPTSQELSLLRRSLLPGLLQVVKFNQDRKISDLRGFEVGRIHFKQGEQHFKEESVAALVLTGQAEPSHWTERAHELDFYDLKGIVEHLLVRLGCENVQWRASSHNALHPGRQSIVSVEEKQVGILGEVHPGVLQRMDIGQRVLFAEINLHALFKMAKKGVRMQPLPLYPGSERDWTVSLPISLSFDCLIKPISQATSPYLEKIELLDVYRGEKVKEGVQNLTLRFYYRDPDKTLQQETVDREHLRLTEQALQSLKELELGEKKCVIEPL